MCGTCGFPAAPGHWTEAGLGTTPHHRLRARMRRTQVLQSVLPGYGLSVSDDVQTPGITLGTMTGSQVIVPNLAELWAAAEALGQRPIDPLDPRFTGGAAGQAAETG